MPGRKQIKYTTNVTCTVTTSSCFQFDFRVSTSAISFIIDTSGVVRPNFSFPIQTFPRMTQINGRDDSTRFQRHLGATNFWGPLFFFSKKKLRAAFRLYLDQAF